MAVTGMGLAFCKPTGNDKKPSIGLRHLHLLSPAAMVHQSQKLDFPFVPLTGHKEEMNPCTPPSFNIEANTKCDANFSFVKGNNFANARSIFKNESLKGCHQFPMISISTLVGGFVGSKSQTPSENRESHQVWDIVFRKLDEFIHSKAAETYANHCYQFQALSQNLIGSLCHNSNSSFGLSYILADTCQPFESCKGSNTNTSSSPTSKIVTETIPLLEETFTPQNSAPPSPSPRPSPSIQSTAVPVLLNIVEHLVSQPDLSERQVSTRTDHPTLETPLVDLPSTIAHTTLQVIRAPTLSTELKQTYAEVAKMANSNLNIDQDRRRAYKNPSKCSRKAKYRHFGQNYTGSDSHQRGMNTNCRPYSPGVKDTRREYFRSSPPAGAGSRGRCWRAERKSDVLTNYGHHSKDLQGLKYFKSMPVSYKGGNLRTVPETITNGNLEIENGEQSSSHDTAKVCESPCPYYNHHKNSCMNWRCRQHVQKPSVKRDLKCILMDNIEDNSDQTYNSDLSPITPESCDIRVNTLGSYFERPLSLSKLTRARFGSNFKDPTMPGPLCDVPSSETCGAGSMAVVTQTCIAVQDLARTRSLSETGDCLPKPSVKERSSSESSESFKNVPRSRSISEESKANSLSSSSISSSSSCKLISESCLRRRFSSECDSEDSFVIFDGGADDDCDSSDSDTESSDDCSASESEDDDEVDAACLRAATVFCLPANVKNACSSLQPPSVNASQKTRHSKINKKVCFAPDKCLETVHLMVAWDFAYRAARCGPWEEIARDRERFKLRVARTEAVLAPVLSAAHREEVLRRREAAPSYPDTSCAAQER